MRVCVISFYVDFNVDVLHKGSDFAFATLHLWTIGNDR